MTLPRTINAYLKGKSLRLNPEISLGSWAWTAVAAGVITYNTVTKDGEMLSEQADRWIAAHPFAARLAVAVVAAHVANIAPRRLDLIHLFFTLARRLR